MTVPPAGRILAICACLLLTPILLRAQSCTLALSARLPLRPGPLVEARINHQPAWLKLDTGSFTTILSPQAALRLHLHADLDKSEHFRGTLDDPYWIEGIGGRRPGTVVRTDSFELGSMHGTMHFMTADIGVGGEDGLLSTDLLQKYDIDLDFAGGQVRIFQATGACGRPKVLLQPPLFVVPLVTDEDDPAPHIHVTIDGHRFLALIDTGAETSVIVKHAARQLDLADSRESGQPFQVHGIGPVAVGAVTHVFDEVGIGDLTIRNMKLTVIETDRLGKTDMLLGADFQQKFHLWISNSARALVLQYPPVASPTIP